MKRLAAKIGLAAPRTHAKDAGKTTTTRNALPRVQPSAVTPTGPPRVPRGGAAPKSNFQRIIASVTPQKTIDRERRAQQWAVVQADAARYHAASAVKSSLKSVDTELSNLVDALKARNLSAIESACTNFEDVQAHIFREIEARPQTAPEDIPDATQLRGACILRLIKTLSKPDSSGATDLTKLHALHKSLGKLQKDDAKNPLITRLHNDPLITHLACAVKAELLHHGMDHFTLDGVQQERDGALKLHGLHQLTAMGTAARDIAQWMDGQGFGVEGEVEGSKGTLRYGNAIPGSSLTVDKLVEVKPQAGTAAAILRADEVRRADTAINVLKADAATDKRTDDAIALLKDAITLDLSTVPLRDLRHLKTELDWLRQTQKQTPDGLAASKTLRKELSAAITERRAKVAERRAKIAERDQHIVAAKKTTENVLAEFQRTLREALLVTNSKLLPTELLGHTVEAGKAMALLEKQGIRLSQKERTEWIHKTLEGADPGALKRLQSGLHFGDCKWMQFELTECGTVRARAAAEHLTVLKAALDALVPVPLPPDRPMLRLGRAPLAVSWAFAAHPFPMDEDLQPQANQRQQ